MAIDLGPDGLTLGSTTVNDWADVGGGKILQVLQKHKTNTASQSISANTVTNIGDMNVLITPSATTSKILIMGLLSHETNDANYNQMLGIRRDTTIIGSGASSGSRAAGLSHVWTGYYASDSDSTMDGGMVQFIDSPNTTSAVRYHLTFRSAHACTLYTNRTVSDLNAAGYERAASSLILMEIGA